MPAGQPTRQTQSSDEAVDCVGHRRIWSELAEKCFLSRWENPELQIKAGCQLVPRVRHQALPEVVGDRLRQGIRRSAWNSGLIGKPAQRIADRHMYPGTTQLNRPAVEDMNGVEPPADTVSCLQDDTIDFRLTQGVGNRQPSNARPYDHDPLYRPDDPAGDISAPAVEQPFRHAHPHLPRDAEH